MLVLGLAGACAVTASASEADADSDDVVMLDTIVVMEEADTAKTVSREEINSETLEALQVSSVAEVLSSLPNVEVKGGVRPAGQSISIWGFGEQEDIRVSFDGMQKDFEKYRQGTIFIDLELLQKVEVEKGTFSPETYAAFGGSVELTSKSARDMLLPGQTRGAFTKFGFASNGNTMTSTGAVYARSEEHGLDFLLALTNRSGGRLKTGDGEELIFSDGDTYSGHFKGSYERNDHYFELSGATSYSNKIEPYDSMRGQVESASSADDALLRLAVDRTTKDRLLSAKYNYNPVSDLIDLNVRAGWSQTSQHDLSPVEDQVRSYYIGGDENWLTYDTYELEINNTSRFESDRFGGLSSALSFGVQLRHQERDSWARVSEFVTYAFYDPADYNNGFLQLGYAPGGTELRRSFWAEYALNFGDRFEIIPGIRYDHVRLNGDENVAAALNNPDKGHDFGEATYSGWSPSLRMLYRVNDSWSLFGDLAYKFRAPMIDELYSNSAYRSTNLHLEAEKVASARLGAKADFYDLLGRGETIQFKGAVFYNKVYDNINTLFGSANFATLPDSLEHRPQYLNMTGYHTKGIELQAKYDSERMFGSIAFSAMDGEHNGLLSDRYASENERVADLSPTTLATVLGVKFPDLGVTAGWRASFVKSMRTGEWQSSPEPTKGYAVHDIFASWTPTDGRFAGLELRASVDNVLNKEYTPYQSLYPAKGRSFKASLSYRF